MGFPFEQWLHVRGIWKVSYFPDAQAVLSNQLHQNLSGWDPGISVSKAPVILEFSSALHVPLFLQFEFFSKIFLKNDPYVFHVLWKIFNLIYAYYIYTHISLHFKEIAMSQNKILWVHPDLFLVTPELQVPPLIF